MNELTEYLETLKKAYAELKDDSIRLRAENSVFRVTLLQDLTTLNITKQYFANFKSIWTERPPEDILLFQGLLEKHIQVLAELVALKRKTISSEKLKARDLALIKEAEVIRGKAPKYVQAAVGRHETERQKVIKAWAKQFKITYAQATIMLEETEKKIKKG